jgi:glutathione S-transferase
VPNGERSYVWKITGQRYYQVPVIRDGRRVVFEEGDASQTVARYLDERFDLGLFPLEHEGVQDILAGYFENEVEGFGFRLNDIHARELVAPSDWLPFLRHKERRFGKGCLDAWRKDQRVLMKGLRASLAPCERMLASRPFLLANRPLFVDFDLYGMVGNFLYSGHYKLPAGLGRLAAWYARMSVVTLEH